MRKMNQNLFKVLTLNKRYFSTSKVNNAIKNVTVVGGGTMGQGIAQVVASSGYNVTVVDQNQKILDKTISGINTSLKRVVKKKFEKDPKDGDKFIEDVMSRIKSTILLEDAAQHTDLVIEAIVENMRIKHQLFSELDKIAPNGAILTSNTSSLSIEEIAKPVVRKDKFGGLHFFNPVPVMKLLEVIRIPTTSDATFNALLEFGKSIGKTTVSCKDTPGFIVNRLLIPYMAESLQMYERGDASFKDIDVAMKLGAGFPMGPFELMDYNGSDTGKYVFEAWRNQFPDNPAFKKSEIVEKLNKEGKLGRKTGEGFYKYK